MDDLVRDNPEMAPQLLRMLNDKLQASLRALADTQQANEALRAEVARLEAQAGGSGHGAQSAELQDLGEALERECERSRRLSDENADLRALYEGHEGVGAVCVNEAELGEADGKDCLCEGHRDFLELQQRLEQQDVAYNEMCEQVVGLEDQLKLSEQTSEARRLHIEGLEDREREWCSEKEQLEKANAVLREEHTEAVYKYSKYKKLSLHLSSTTHANATSPSVKAGPSTLPPKPSAPSPAHTPATPSTAQANTHLRPPTPAPPASPPEAPAPPPSEPRRTPVGPQQTPGAPPASVPVPARPPPAPTSGALYAHRSTPPSSSARIPPQVLTATQRRTFAPFRARQPRTPPHASTRSACATAPPPPALTDAFTRSTFSATRSACATTRPALAACRALPTARPTLTSQRTLATAQPTLKGAQPAPRGARPGHAAALSTAHRRTNLARPRARVARTPVPAAALSTARRRADAYREPRATARAGSGRAGSDVGAAREACRGAGVPPECARGEACKDVGREDGVGGVLCVGWVSVFFEAWFSEWFSFL
ncbi:hypothetical protein PsYK624_104950 [Phanerochaete sordida]|uniref:Uncharacterized protein n=1 Tax=Phanerochaete sordida TaxID=48140 RepID=A0A9P3GG52_9APHY|nr:hypothetical protein PsYK624_104950 [Phanerochaete sordida]